MSSKGREEEEGLLYKAHKEVSNQSVSLGGAQEMVSFSVLFLVSLFRLCLCVWNVARLDAEMKLTCK